MLGTTSQIKRSFWTCEARGNPEEKQQALTIQQAGTQQCFMNCKQCQTHEQRGAKAKSRMAQPLPGSVEKQHLLVMLPQKTGRSLTDTGAPILASLQCLNVSGQFRSLPEELVNCDLT